MYYWSDTNQCSIYMYAVHVAYILYYTIIVHTKNVLQSGLHH